MYYTGTGSWWDTACKWGCAWGDKFHQEKQLGEKGCVHRRRPLPLSVLTAQAPPFRRQVITSLGEDRMAVREKAILVYWGSVLLSWQNYSSTKFPTNIKMPREWGDGAKVCALSRVDKGWRPHFLCGIQRWCSTLARRGRVARKLLSVMWGNLQKTL